MIVDTYGIPNYKEINPALYTCITFPFLFGVMYGDIGHGSVIALVGLTFCWFGPLIVKKVPDLEGLYTYRYMFTLMGLFAVFCGTMYNDFMSLPLNLFGSCYNLETGKKLDVDCVYPVGVDPAWFLTK